MAAKNAFGIMMLTTLVGVPIAVRLAQPHMWGKRFPHDHEGRAQEQLTGPGFKPMDLGPDPVQWPSESPWHSGCGQCVLQEDSELEGLA